MKTRILISIVVGALFGLILSEIIGFLSMITLQESFGVKFLPLYCSILFVGVTILWNGRNVKSSN